MPSETIYSILSSKPHNPHYLNRYWKFIQSRNSCSGYTEIHHICPKAKDLFPEYASLKTHPWNKIKLTAREHFISHWLLYKAYGGSQAFAFRSMCNGQKSKYQDGRYVNINSSAYATLREIGNSLSKNNNTGMSSYYDLNGDIVWCKTTHPKVLSGEYTSLTKNRKQPRKNKTNYNYNSVAKRYPNKTIRLYFLDITITVKYHSAEFVEYLNQGWSSTITKEYRTKRAIDSNKTRSAECRKRAGQSLSLKLETIPKKECPFCGILCSPRNLSRWHGHKCKLNPHNSHKQ